MAWCIIHRVMYVPSVQISSINILGRTIFNGELNPFSRLGLKAKLLIFAVWVDMSVFIMWIKAKMILSSVKSLHSAQLGVHEDDDEGRILLDHLTCPKF
jgi:hypothetical protein